MVDRSQSARLFLPGPTIGPGRIARMKPGAAGHPPATTMVEVARLIHPEMLIEIEADAVVRE